MHDLSDLLQNAPRKPFSVRPELLVGLYVGVAILVGGVGLLIKSNLDHIGPVALLTGIFVASGLCYAVALRARSAGRERSLPEDYVLLLAALLFSTAMGYAAVKFRWFGTGWSWYLLLVAAWHLATAYFFRSRLVLSVALTAFAGWVATDERLVQLLGAKRDVTSAAICALLCALVFWIGGHQHRGEPSNTSSGFRDVYRQFAVNFAFWGALALGASDSTLWIGALLLAALAFVVGRAGLIERRQSFLLYAVGYTTIGLIRLEAKLFGGIVIASGLGLLTVIGAVVLLLKLRARLKESEA